MTKFTVIKEGVPQEYVLTERDSKIVDMFAANKEYLNDLADAIANLQKERNTLRESLYLNKFAFQKLSPLDDATKELYERKKENLTFQLHYITMKITEIETEYTYMYDYDLLRLVTPANPPANPPQTT